MIPWHKYKYKYTEKYNYEYTRLQFKGRRRWARFATFACNWTLAKKMNDLQISQNEWQTLNCNKIRAVISCFFKNELIPGRNAKHFMNEFYPRVACICLLIIRKRLTLNFFQGMWCSNFFQGIRCCKNSWVSGSLLLLCFFYIIRKKLKSSFKERSRQHIWALLTVHFLDERLLAMIGNWNAMKL